MPWLPDLHTPAEDLAFFTRMIPDSVGWVAADVEDGTVVGFALTRDGWLDHLYVDPEHRGTGAGSALLQAAILEAGPDIRLWVFQRNHQARAFYLTRGFVEIESTDGADNEEHEPDVLMQLRQLPISARTA